MYSQNEKRIFQIEQLSAGPSLLMVLQRENGLLLFDSIIER